MGYFPLFIDIKDKRCLVVGGGKVSLRKTLSLLEFGCKIVVVSPMVLEEFEEISQIEIIKRKFLKEDLEGCFIVIAATNDREENIKIAGLSRERGIHVNVADVLEECSFYFPSFYRKAPVCISITTEGQSPYISKKLREKIERETPEFYSQIALRLGKLKDRLKEEVEEVLLREEILKKAGDLMIESENHISDEEIERIIRGKYEN